MTLRRTTRRWLALASCAFFVAGGMIAREHQASSDHGYCSDHGELIHLHDLAPGLATTAAQGDSVLPPLRVQGEHGCLALHLLVTPFVESDDPTESATRRATSAGRSTQDHAAYAPIAILRSAPKNSPPRV